MAAIANCALYAITSLVFMPISVPERLGLVLIMAACFLGIGALSALWTKKWWLVTLPVLASFLWAFRGREMGDETDGYAWRPRALACDVPGDRIAARNLHGTLCSARGFTWLGCYETARVASGPLEKSVRQFGQGTDAWALGVGI